MNVWLSDSGAVATLCPTGELDLGELDRLRAALLQAQDATRLIVVDLAWVTFMDSAAIGVLIGGWKRAQQQQKHVLVIQARPAIVRVLRLLGVADVLMHSRAPQTIDGPSAYL